MSLMPIGGVTTICYGSEADRAIERLIQDEESTTPMPVSENQPDNTEHVNSRTYARVSEAARARSLASAHARHVPCCMPWPWPCVARRAVEKKSRQLGAVPLEWANGARGIGYRINHPDPSSKYSVGPMGIQCSLPVVFAGLVRNCFAMRQPWPRFLCLFLAFSSLQFSPFQVNSPLPLRDVRRFFYGSFDLLLTESGRWEGRPKNSTRYRRNHNPDSSRTGVIVQVRVILAEGGVARALPRAIDKSPRPFPSGGFFKKLPGGAELVCETFPG